MTDPALRWYLALPMAGLGGVTLRVALPEPGWWPAMFAGVVLILISVWMQRARWGLLLGAVAGAGFWLPGISWLTLYLGPVPWLGLSSVMILWYALMGLGIGIATRGIAEWLERGSEGRGDRARRRVIVLAQSLAAAGLWVLREQVQGAWPYGGFAWGRLAHTQADGPLAAVVSWTGFSGFTGLLALACAIPVAAWFARARPRTGLGFPQRAASAAVATGVVTATLLLASLVPVAPVAEAGSITVAAVQGNSKSGIFDDRENGDVFRAHLEETERAVAAAMREGTRIDVIVWPENSAEFQLPDHVYRMRALERLSERAGAPIVIGTILQDPDGNYTNSALVVDADGLTGARYDKRRPVPFAEYMPHRAFYRTLAPELVDLVQLEYQHGTRSAVIPVELEDRTVQAALAICFDIIFDDHAVAMMADGGRAQVIFAQTNNADFGRTDESAQQLQIARLRAIETGRAVVNISTVGTSAIVLPDGSDRARLPTHTSNTMVARVPLAEGLTPALRFGGIIAAGWMLVGVAGVLCGVLARVRRRGSALTDARRRPDGRDRQRDERE